MKLWSTNSGAELETDITPKTGGLSRTFSSKSLSGMLDGSAGDETSSTTQSPSDKAYSKLSVDTNEKDRPRPSTTSKSPRATEKPVLEYHSDRCCVCALSDDGELAVSVVLLLLLLSLLLSRLPDYKQQLFGPQTHVCMSNVCCALHIHTFMLFM